MTSEVYVHVRHRGGATDLAGRYRRVAPAAGQPYGEFAYVGSWLRNDHGRAFALDPEHLPLQPGPFRTTGRGRLPGVLADATPDRWGRRLIAHRRPVDRSPMTAGDWLLATGDERVGCLAFSETPAPPPPHPGYAATADTRLNDDDGMLLTEVDGRDARVRVDGTDLAVRLPARGTHYAVDALTALAATRAALGTAFDAARATAAISGIAPVFGRGEVVTVRGTSVEFVLVQNPASFQLNVDSLAPGTEQILVAVGSDVRDPSYLWPADTSGLGHVLIASGSKAHDIALQLVYDGVTVDRVEPDLGRALDDFLALPEPATGMKTIIFSADSMRRTRAHLGLATNEANPS